MNNLKKVVAVFCLIAVFAITALGGEIPSPPCAPPDPGEIPSPPCAAAQLATDDPKNPGDIQSPPTAETVVIATIADAALGAFLSVF